MKSNISNITGLADGFENILLGVSIVFTIGVIISLIIISRQVMKSKWIDSNSIKVLFGLIFISILAIAGSWVSYLFYI